MADTPAQAKLTPTKYGLGVGGVALFGTGGCLMWTIVLIPLAIPMALIGMVMAVASLFVKTEPLACPACQAVSKVEKKVTVAQCPHCGTAIKRRGATWIRV